MAFSRWPLTEADPREQAKYTNFRFSIRLIGWLPSQSLRTGGSYSCGNIDMARESCHSNRRVDSSKRGVAQKRALGKNSRRRQDTRRKDGNSSDGWILCPRSSRIGSTFISRDAVSTGRTNPDETEEVETVLIPVDKIRDYIREGRITSAVMIAALHLFFIHQEA